MRQIICTNHNKFFVQYDLLQFRLVVVVSCYFSQVLYRICGRRTNTIQETRWKCTWHFMHLSYKRIVMKRKVTYMSVVSMQSSFMKAFSIKSWFSYSGVGLTVCVCVCERIIVRITSCIFCKLPGNLVKSNCKNYHLWFCTTQQFIHIYCQMNVGVNRRTDGYGKCPEPSQYAQKFSKNRSYSAWKWFK